MYKILCWEYSTQVLCILHKSFLGSYFFCPQMQPYLLIVTQILNYQNPDYSGNEYGPVLDHTHLRGNLHSHDFFTPVDG